MKIKTLFKISGLLLIISLLINCSSTNVLTINTTQPAPVYLPLNIKRIGVLDRTLTLEKNKQIDNLDKILSAEGKNLDKDGAHSTVLGLYDELKNNANLTEVKLIDSTDLRSPGMGVFPASITWEQIERVCDKHQVEALFVLSFYDTDSKVSYSTKTVQIKNPLGVSIPAIEHHASINTIIKTGWRIYDPVNKIIRDEIIITKNITSTGKGINPLKAAEAVIGRKEAVLQISKRLGSNYAFRILPYRLRVSRNYYVRGTNNFKIGKRRAQTGDWNGAAELWKEETSNPKGKIAGRAYYNMAISNEINGNLNEAVSWASKAYTDYRTKYALRYVNILKNRIQKEKQLEEETQEL